MLVEDLLDAIRDELRGMVRNGQTTERGLARRAGVSQAHVHNLLKGARLLTPSVADRILRALEISILDVINVKSSLSPRRPTAIGDGDWLNAPPPQPNRR